MCTIEAQFVVFGGVGGGGGCEVFGFSLCRFWCSHCVPHCSQHVLSVFS